ncbi:hypothetical protein [Amycolatopsis speibonae]|uniref:Aminoglycoside phosphotransferase domain-containing protein n=1 Tax=Amycolatopsis speibonae TaxID=1450224 RepID=A0ABV7P6L7_9PSEU
MTDAEPGLVEVFDGWLSRRLPTTNIIAEPESEFGAGSAYRIFTAADQPNPITLERTLATSPNVAFVDLERKIGIPAVIDMADRLSLRKTLASKVAGEQPVPTPTGTSPRASTFKTCCPSRCGTAR